MNVMAPVHARSTRARILHDRKRRATGYADGMPHHSRLGVPMSNGDMKPAMDLNIVRM